MSTPPQPPFKARGLLLRPALAAPAGRYAAMAAAPHTAVDGSMRWDKRLKSSHRFTIAAEAGPLTLTVPVAKPREYHSATLDSVTVSSHGNWWRLHLTALESAYGRTPFFEFYIDRFRPLLSAETVGRSLTWLTAAWDSVVCPILHLPVPSKGGGESVNPELWDDCRNADPVVDLPPYWQVRAARFGFIPGMSVLDLIFNLGPEAPLYIRPWARM